MDLNISNKQIGERVKNLVGDGKKKIVLNMTNVRYIDSAGLGALVAAHVSAKKEGAALLLSDLGTKFHEVMQVTRLLTVFNVFDTEAEAISSFDVTQQAATA